MVQTRAPTRKRAGADGERRGNFRDQRRDDAYTEGMAEERSARIIAVGGGKGGVGKTLVSTNLALALAERGQRTLLVDADLGGANAHTVLGIAPPLATLSDVVERRASVADVAVVTPYANLRFVSGALDDISAANPNHAAKMRLLRQLGRVDGVDVVVLDLGAGTGFNTIDFFLIAHTSILVVLPEPTSVENAYRFLKAAFFRRLAVVEKVYGIADILELARAQRNALGVHTPADLLAAIEKKNPDVGRQVRTQMARFEPRLILNQALPGELGGANDDDGQVARDMASACRRFLGIPARVLGVLPEDEAVRRAVRQRQPLRLAAPDAPIKRGLDAVADRLLAEFTHGEVAA
jgi:flagellar biosynthesis protein FlhG